MHQIFCPDLVVKSLFEIDLDQLRDRGISGIIIDLDNTIVPWDSFEICPNISSWLEKLLAKGFKVSIVSNNGHGRVRKIAADFGVPFVSRALKPTKRGFLKALDLMSLRPAEAAVIGDQLLTDILGGNRIGLLTIWVQPLSSHEFIMTKLHRKVEKLVVFSLRKRGLLK